MGKTARWFRSLLGSGKKNTSSSTVSDSKPIKEKKKWSFVKSFRDKPQPPIPSVVNERRGSYREGSSSTSNAYFQANDPNKHAIAVAAATAAVAEAAVAAAQAAAAVVRLTSSGRCTTTDGIRVDVWAAVKIQSAFRGYLARRALKALKGLVKLQALVRGHIMRKKTMRCMQALVRVQSRARVGRMHISETPHPNIKSSMSQPGPATPENYERTIRSNSTRHDRVSPLKRNSSKQNSRDILDWDRTHLGRNCLDNQMDERSREYFKEALMKTGPTEDEKSDKILEIDPGKPHYNPNNWNVSQSSQHSVVLDRPSFMDSPSKDSTTAHLSYSSPSSGEVQSRNPRKPLVEDEPFTTAENSPQFYSASSIPGSSKRGPFTPTKSDCSRSFLSVYSDHPNYMANTESSKAKVRSQSAPKQRLEFEKSSSTKRYHAYGFGDTRITARRASTIETSYTTKAYPGSGRLDRLGMPIPHETISFNGVYRNRY